MKSNCKLPFNLSVNKRLFANKRLFTGILLVMIFFGLNSALKAQCDEDDIVVTSNETWQNRVVEMTEDQKIIITNGATLTMEGCTIKRKPNCSGYWDGIYLVTAINGSKAGLILNQGTRVEFSKNGIKALNGFSEITLDEVEMSDNGRMIDARDNWPFAPITIGGGAFSGSNGNRTDPEPVSVYDIGCDPYGTPTPPEVTITNNCILKVTENGNATVNPPKFIKQISVLGGELIVSRAIIMNGQSTYLVNAIAASRGKCKIFGGTSIEGFWLGVYKGTDASAHCVSEGLVLNGSQIINTDLHSIFNAPGFAVYNVSADALIKENILEANVSSTGISYGTITGNNIYYAYSPLVSVTTLQVHNPEEAFIISNNRLLETPMEFFGSNIRTDVRCNIWEDETYAVVANPNNVFPLSWGTKKVSAGNIWEEIRSEMYNLSIIDPDMNYYYRILEDSEEFDFKDGFEEEGALNENILCSSIWPTSEGTLDTSEYTVLIEDLEEEYEVVLDSINYLIANSDTSLASVKEELAELDRILHFLVGQGFLFHITSDSAFWTEKLNSKVEELLGLNYLWFGHDMFSVQSHLKFHPDQDAQVLYEASSYMESFFDSGKNLYTLNTSQIDSLETLAEESFGDYTNILRNYLYMVYDRFIPWDHVSLLDSLRSNAPLQARPNDNPVETFPEFIVSPNPFNDKVEISKSVNIEEDSPYLVSIFNINGTAVYKSLLPGSNGQLDLTSLDYGFYILKIENRNTGSIEVKRIFKTQ